MKYFKITIINLILLVVTLCFLDFIMFTYETFKYERPNFVQLIQKYHSMYSYPHSFIIDDVIENKEIGDVYGKQYNSKPIIVTGCSFAYGLDLSDEDKFSYKLSEKLKRPVYNYAVNGGGISTAIYIMLNDFFKDIQNPEYLVYVYIPAHKDRIYRYFNSPRESRTYPRYKSKNGEIKYIPRNNNFINEIFLYKYIEDTINLNVSDARKEEDMISLFDIFIKELKNRYKDIKIIILAYEETPTFNYESLDEIDNVTVVNLEDILPNYDICDNEEYQLEDKWHPNGEAWDIITPKIAEIINHPILYRIIKEVREKRNFLE